MSQIRLYIIGSLPVQLIGLYWLKSKPDWIENVYSQTFYPLLFKSHRFFFQHIPFSIGDVFYAIALFLIALSLYRIKFKSTSIKTLILNLFAIFSILHLLFYINWGLHYYRIPLAKKLSYPTTYTESQLEKALKNLISNANTIHSSLVKNDSMPVVIPYSKEKLGVILSNAFQDVEGFSIVQPFAKNSLWSTMLSYMGYAGYLNPFTLESQVNKKIPALSYITTAVHEMAHQTGIAAENEANFIAFYNCISHEDPYVQYAGFTFALRYCYSELFKANPDKAKATIEPLNAGIIVNFREQSAFWEDYENPFEPYLKKGYDQYLKANGQAQGILSYNAMVTLVVAFSEKENLQSNKIH